MRASWCVIFMASFLLLSGRLYSYDDLFDLIQKGNMEDLNALLDQNTSLLNHRNDDGMTPLNYASYLGNAEIVRELLLRDADISIGDNDNSLPIHCAAISGDTATIDLLLSHGADINARDNNGLTPLIFAISYRRFDAANFLLDRNGDVTISANNSLNPLHYAAFVRQPELVEKIIDEGANPNAHTGNSQTPLSIALYNADYETTRILLEHGADVEDTTEDGISLLFYTLAYRDGGIARQMLAKGKNFTQTNSRGMTMLHYAAARGFTDVVELLCEQGVDIDARNIDNKTALYYATIWGHHDVVDLLLRHNARPLSDESLGLSGRYLGQSLPGRHPEPFAEDKLLTPFAPHGRLVLSPDGTEMFWCHQAMPIQAMWYSRQVDGVWQRPAIAPFTDPALDFADGYPTMTSDGNRLYYHSHRPIKGNIERRPESDIWYVEKVNHQWGKPVNLGAPVNTEKGEFSPSVSEKGTLYFIGNEYEDTYGTGDIYVADYVDGKYTTPRNLGASVNGAHHELTPAIAPDESYLIFASDRPAVAEGLNLYVSFRKNDGGWTEVVTFGRSMTSGNAWHPFITPDGKQIIYLRDDNYYWFSTKAVDDLREAVLGHEPDEPPGLVLRRGDQDFGINSTRKIVLADLDADDDLDAVFSCGQIWLNDGNGAFSLKMNNAVRRGHGVDIGDIDKDGDIDIVFSGISNLMYLNDGKANFEKSGQAFGDSTAGAFNVLLCDFDSDGDLDLAYYYAGDSTVTYLNDGSGQYAISDVRLPSKYASDLDGDGDVDFFERKRGEGCRVLLNDGNGAFTEHWNMPDSTIDYGSVAFGDIDNDGDSDVIVTNGGNDDIYPTLVFCNDGSGAFDLSDMKLPPSRWGNVTFGDLNSDGWLDAFQGNFTLPNCVLMNDTSGLLSDIGLRLGGSAGSMISAIGDLDGDGDLDIFVSNFEGGSNEIWFNETE